MQLIPKSWVSWWVSWWPPLMLTKTHARLMREERAEMRRMWDQRLQAEADLTERGDRGRESWE